MVAIAISKQYTVIVAPAAGTACGRKLQM